MSAFICAECDNLSDADDGCMEAPDGYRLICERCMNEIEAEEPVPNNVLVVSLEEADDLIAAMGAQGFRTSEVEIVSGPLVSLTFVKDER